MAARTPSTHSVFKGVAADLRGQVGALDDSLQIHEIEFILGRQFSFNTTRVLCEWNLDSYA